MDSKKNEGRFSIMHENYTFDEWQTELKQRYQELYKTVNELIPELWTPLEFALSIQKILNIKGCSLPFAGILLGAPSSMKTVVVELFRNSKNTYYTDNFSPKSFVSHYAGMKEEQLKKIDMLPMIKSKFFLCSELSPMFTKKEEELNETIGLITRVLDGQGLVTNTGACGQRGYNEEIMFTWLGAAVDVPNRVHKLMGTRGAKLHFLRLSKNKKTENELLATMDKDDFLSKIKKIKLTLLDYLQWFDRCPISEDETEQVTTENNLIKIKWDNDKDDEYTKRVIIRSGILLGHLRAVVTTWETYGSQGLDYNYGTTILEQPERAITQLRNLARAHALSQGRNWITIEDLPLLIKVVLSTASIDRVNIFDLLIAHNGVLTTKTITESLNTTAPTARRIMAELKAVGLVDLKEPETQTEEKEITLKQEFDWFLTDEFKKLHEGFKPTDNSEFVKEYCKKYNISLKEKTPPCKQQEIQYTYSCYECARVNHGFQTNSKSDYERHWITSNHKGTCYPAIVDINFHGWEPQGKDWEI
jgi:predicted transcriptional regulator